MEYSSKIESMYLMLGLNETIDQLAMESSVHWYGHVMRRKDGNGLRKASYFEAKS